MRCIYPDMQIGWAEPSLYYVCLLSFTLLSLLVVLLSLLSFSSSSFFFSLFRRGGGCCVPCFCYPLSTKPPEWLWCDVGLIVSSPLHMRLCICARAPGARSGTVCSDNCVSPNR